jgi:GNAT superfamily N-acetyltransferase
VHATTSATIRQATGDDVPQVAVTLARAFHYGPFADWFMPNVHDRRLLYPSMFRLITDHALAHGGHVDVIFSRHNHDTIAGAAVWYKRMKPPADDFAFDHQMAKELGPYADRWALVATSFEARHPTEPYWYLAYIGVSTNLQRIGLGGQLLRHGHTRVDRDGLPAYLEASSAEVRSLYAANGYTAGAPLLVAPRAAPVWPMTRPAGGATASGPPVPSPPPQTPATKASAERTPPVNARGWNEPHAPDLTEKETPWTAHTPSGFDGRNSSTSPRRARFSPSRWTTIR